MFHIIIRTWMHSKGNTYNVDFQQYIFSPPYSEWLCRGIVFTLWISLLTSICSLFLGLLVCALRMSRHRIARTLGVIYIGLFRNIPPVPLLLLLVFGFPGFHLYLTGSELDVDMCFYFLILGLSLNTSSYIADIFRSGVMGIPATQVEAAKVLGLSRMDIRLRVIMPQALRIAFPALGTRLIHNMKNSAVALVLPIRTDNMEIMGQAGRIAGQTFSWAEPLIFAAVVYTALSLLLSFAVEKSSTCLCGNARGVR